MVDRNFSSPSLWCAKDLPELPQFLVTLITKAKAELEVQKIIIFGSRARGDHKPQSDFDLCFYKGISKAWTSDKWARFVIDSEEDKATLCSIDFVNYEEATPELKLVIYQTGILIYERS